jgi:heme A synthase
VRARQELVRFGWSWIALGAALLVVDFATGSAARLDSAELTLILVLIGLSLGCVLGALLLARRTGPEILYYRILDRAPPPPPVPRERSSATTRRVIPPAIGIVIGLLVAGFIGAVMMLVLGGQPRDEIGDDLAGATLLTAAAWTLACGGAGLRMASYFAHWERRRTAEVFCRPLKAGTMRPVYWVERG